MKTGMFNGRTNIGPSGKHICLRFVFLHCVCLFLVICQTTNLKIRLFFSTTSWWNRAMGFRDFLQKLGVWTTVLKWNEPRLYRLRLKGDWMSRLALALAAGSVPTT